MTAKLIINREMNGLELYFPTKPEDSVLSMLRDAKWRFHRVKKCWYAKQTPANKVMAETLTGIASVPLPEHPYVFIPAYDKVDGTSIYPSSDISCWEHDDGYFADLNAFISVRPNRIIIIDLRNALIPGKKCDRLTLEPEDEYDSTCLHAGLDTFHAVYDRFFVQRELPDCRIYASKVNAMRTFTPFKQIKPIKTPSKWTMPHVWKAILSGQIYLGHCDGRYTDDYAYDAAVNFRSGVTLHLPSFACDLIENPSGWSAHASPEKDGVIELSVNCHSFDLNTLYFEESCDWAENIRRRDQREAERQQHNAEFEARRLSDVDVLKKTEFGQIFDVTLLEMDGNTDRYSAHQEVMLLRQFFDNGHLWREVLEVKPRPIDNTTLYEIVCGCYVQADVRVICHDERCIVTGKALTELLAEHAEDEQISAVSVCRQSISDLQDALDDQLTGRVRSLFNPVPRAKTVKILEQLAKEAERAYDAV